MLHQWSPAWLHSGHLQNSHLKVHEHFQPSTTLSCRLSEQMLHLAKHSSHCCSPKSMTCLHNNQTSFFLVLLRTECAYGQALKGKREVTYLSNWSSSRCFVHTHIPYPAFSSLEVLELSLAFWDSAAERKLKRGNCHLCPESECMQKGKNFSEIEC